jgi:hypothetical protein
VTRLRDTLAIFAIALVLTLASTVVERRRLEVQDWDCPPAPQSCARPVLVIGFPLPFISDFHGISVVGSADVISALMGEDLFDHSAFAGNLLFYAALVMIVRFIWGRRGRRMPKPGS